MSKSAGIEITNLGEFRAALRRAEDANPRALTKAIKAAGAPVLAKTAALAPVGGRADDRHHGQLRASYRLRASGTSGSIVSLAPYGGGAEWGMNGKWKGFRRYGPRGRFAWRAVQESRDEITQIIYDGLSEIITIEGWASPS